MNNMKKNATGIIIIFAALLLLVVSLIFQCSPMENGTYMNCHKANLTVAALSCSIALLGIFFLIVKDASKQCIFLGFTCVIAIANIIIPGNLISLCMMPEMTCRAMFRPITILCSLIICLVSIAGFIFVKRAKS